MSTRRTGQSDDDIVASNRNSREAAKQNKRMLEEMSQRANASPRQQRIRYYKSLPKITPEEPSLRDCLIANLSSDDMAMIRSRAGTLEYIDTMHKVTRFDLWSAYKQDIKDLKDRPVADAYYDATHCSRSPELRKHRQQLAAVIAIFHLLEDPTLLPAREVSDLNKHIAKGKPGSTGKPRV